MQAIRQQTRSHSREEEFLAIQPNREGKNGAGEKVTGHTVTLHERYAGRQRIGTGVEL